MKIREQLQDFKNAFFHPRVFIFILLGTAVMFLTFLVNNNAMEIAISGIASVFIGIGVNNFSALETHLRDVKKMHTKLGHALKVLTIVKSRLKGINRQIKVEDLAGLRLELVELHQIVSLSIGLIEEENILD